MEEGAQKQAVRRELAAELLRQAVSVLPDGRWGRDLRGVGCPLVWAKARLTLEHLPTDGVLSLKLDAGEPMENVPRALVAEGFVLLERQRLSDGNWELTVCRSGPKG